MIAGLTSVLPSSKVGNVTRLMEFCASLPGPGHGCWTLLMSHCAEHICETMSYVRVSNEGVLNGITAAGSMVGLLAGSLVCVESDKGAGVLVGANTTFTCTHI
jgi:hypothetical protein